MAAKSKAPLRVRPARPRDFPVCARVCLAALRDLSRRQGVPPPNFPARNLYSFYRHARKTDPHGFHVGVVRGRVVCYAITILRERTHFLAQFFALPGAQSRGIGRQVLAHAFEASRPPRGAVRCLVASLDLRAQALYLKFGMQPRTIMYHVTGRPAAVASEIELRQVGPTGRSTSGSLALAAKFDRPLREARRDVDQRYFMAGVPGSRFFEARHRGETIGYVVIRGNGAIGPGGVRRAFLS
ncbi:MAG TPA: GNAT family N-acetyltransferase, partial [Thermoplasmata archaeon]|nr:GNAT family N-acetyltransferase [Thermoplasmata archaeon]